MSKYKLTPEQVQVVHHPLGSHALVLAVAGSGKSTTMAHRIKHLVQERLGHSSISLTLDTYSHVLPDMQNEVAETMDELVTPIDIGLEITELTR